MSTISIGRTPLDLRRRVNGLTPTDVDPEHHTVLELIRSQGYYELHPTEVARVTGWSRARANRVMDELAETLGLVRVKIKSPWGLFLGWQWGTWVASAAWPVVAWWDGEQFVDGVPNPAESMIMDESATTVTATVTNPNPAPEPTTDTPTPQATVSTGTPPENTRATTTVTATVTDPHLTALLNSTMLSNPNAARTMLTYVMRTQDMDADTAVARMIEMSTSGWALTRKAVDAYRPEAAPTVEDAPEDDRFFYRRMDTATRIRDLAATHPEYERGAWFLMALNDHDRPVTVSALHADRWQSQADAQARCQYTAEDVHRVVGAMIDAGREVEPVGVGSALRRVALAA